MHVLEIFPPVWCWWLHLSLAPSSHFLLPHPWLTTILGHWLALHSSVTRSSLIDSILHRCSGPAGYVEAIGWGLGKVQAALVLRRPAQMPGQLPEGRQQAGIGPLPPGRWGHCVPAGHDTEVISSEPLPPLRVASSRTVGSGLRGRSPRAHESMRFGLSRPQVRVKAERTIPWRWNSHYPPKFATGALQSKSQVPKGKAHHLPLWQPATFHPILRCHQRCRTS